MGAFSVRQGAALPRIEAQESLWSMTALTPVSVAPRPPGLSGEVRRFSTGMRAIVAMLCTALLQQSQGLAANVLPLQLAYCAWAGALLLCEAQGRPLGKALLPYWIDVAWAVLLVQIAGGKADLLAITLVQPVVLASIGFGVGSASLLSLVGAVGLLVDVPGALGGTAWLETSNLVPALGVLALGPLAATLARPMNVLRARLDLISGLEDQLDARRGSAAMAEALVQGLLVRTRADVAGLVLPAQPAPRATLATPDDGAFQTSGEVHAQLAALLARLPHCPVSHVERRRFGLRGGTRAHVDAHTPAWDGDLRAPMQELAKLLQVRSLRVVPLLRYGRAHGHLLVGSTKRRAHLHDIDALADAAPELHRLVEQAALVDQLQDESAAHERVRIGRDLHDSAIQPYLGLKYAVESVAMRVAADNPARADIDALLDLVNGEVGELREIISGLRAGEPRGDNAFVPAVRRQVRRFALLFGIDVELACQAEIATTRALAGSLFHMVNEALNNVRKHTTAKRVWIRIEHGDAQIRLAVRDDGQRAAPFAPRSLGERAAALGGSLEVHCGEARGAEVTITIPLTRREGAAAA